MLNRLIRQRKIPVEFLDCENAKVDDTLFEKAVYQDIIKNGIKLSPANIIHHASVHYSGRFRNSFMMRFVNSFMDLITSIDDYGDGGLYLTDYESNEFQSNSSEVLAVGICVAFTSKIFSINKNRIGLIEGSGKRCDFYFIKNNQEYYIESKGRKGSITTAIQDVFLKKSNYDKYAPKYGVISQLPRNSEKVNVTVIDPEFSPKDVDANEQVRRILAHYIKLSYMCGLWQLGDLLKERCIAISKGVDYSELDGKPLDYSSVLKLGIRVEVIVDGVNGEAFFSKNNLYDISGKYMDKYPLFLMDSNLIEILEKQDYKKLLIYSLYDDGINSQNEEVLSALNDGSLFSVVTKEVFDSYE